MLTEKELIQHLAEQGDGSHNYAFTVSVAKCIIRLRERYASLSQRFETISLAIRQKKLGRDSTFTQAEWDKAVEYLLAKVTEARDESDVVTLYVRAPQVYSPVFFLAFDTITHHFDLKEVLVLVWIALHDNEAYVDHYQGNPLEKLQQATADQEARIGSFFQILKSIQTGICHLGVRNELILSLNEIHPDVNVIESPEGIIINFIRQRLNHFFWEAYQNNPNLPILRRGLITWMKESNVRELFLHFDPTNQLQKDICSFFDRYDIALHPAIIKFGGKSLEAYVRDVQSALDFDCDKVRYPHLYEMQQLLTASDEFFQPKALEKILNWVSSDSFFLNINANQRHVSAFYKYYIALVQLKKYRSIFTFMKVLENDFMNTLQRNCEKPFIDYLESNSFPALSYTATSFEQIQVFTKAIERFKKEKPIWIIDFFEKWYTEQNNSLRRTLFKMMISSDLKDKISINADDIVEFKRCVFVRGRINLEGQIYWINKFFLTAITIHPSQWSNEFANYLEMIYKYLQRLDGPQLRARNINPDAYPPHHFIQLQYLHEKYKQFRGLQRYSAVPVRPENMLLHPELCETYHEWLNIDKLLSESYPDEQQRVFEGYRERIWDAILKLPAVIILSPDMQRFLSTRENKALIMSDLFNAPKIIACLNVFYAMGPSFFNDNTRLFIKQNYQMTDLIVPAIKCLYATSPTLINDRYLDLLTPGAGIYAIQIANIVQLLYNVNKGLLNKERCALIKEKGYIARYLAQILRILEGTNKNLINEANLTLFMTHNVQHLWCVSEALSVLFFDIKPNIINQLLLEELIENAHDAIGIAHIIHFLSVAKPELLTVEHLKLIYNQPHVAAKLVALLSTIQRLIPSFITKDNFKVLFNVSKYHNHIIETLRFLQKTSADLIKEETLNILLSHSHQLINLNEVLSALHRINPELINEINLNLIFKEDIVLVLKVKRDLEALSCSNPEEKITNEVFRNLFSHPIKHWESCSKVGYGK